MPILFQQFHCKIIASTVSSLWNILLSSAHLWYALSEIPISMTFYLNDNSFNCNKWIIRHKPTWTTLTNLVIEMLNAFQVRTTKLIIGGLPLELKILFKVFNQFTHDCLISQPSSQTSVISSSHCHAIDCRSFQHLGDKTPPPLSPPSLSSCSLFS